MHLGEGEMRYSTKMKWEGGEWWVELLLDGDVIADVTFDDWRALGATQEAIMAAVEEADLLERSKRAPDQTSEADVGQG